MYMQTRTSPYDYGHITSRGNVLFTSIQQGFISIHKYLLSIIEFITSAWVYITFLMGTKTINYISIHTSTHAPNHSKSHTKYKIPQMRQKIQNSILSPLKNYPIIIQKNFKSYPLQPNAINLKYTSHINTLQQYQTLKKHPFLSILSTLIYLKYFLFNFLYI